MRFSIGATYKVNTDNYESVEVSAHVTVDDVDLFEDPRAEDPDVVMKALQDDAKRYLNMHLEPELDRLAPLAHRDSMLAQTTPPTAPARRERSTRSKRSKS